MKIVAGLCILVVAAVFLTEATGTLLDCKSEKATGTKCEETLIETSLYTNVRFEVEFQRNPGSESVQQISFFNDQGILEHYVTFWDEPIQKIRVGNDLTKCYFTRFIPPQSKVTGDKVLVAIELEATDQVARLTINGKDPMINDPLLSPYKRKSCDHEPKDFAKMVFTSTAPLELPVQFRYEIKYWTLNVVCDDVMTLWIDGEETKVDGQGVWNQLSTLNLPMSTRSIAIKCQNTGGPGGIAASVQDAYGHDILVTDDTWSCSNTADSGWESPDFEQGDNWEAASYFEHWNYVDHDSGPWKDISMRKQVIWTASSSDMTVYCRKFLPGDLAHRCDPGHGCMEKGVDYKGADIKNVNPVLTVEECTALCREEDGCVSLTHRPSTHDCWLKNKRNGENGKSLLDDVVSVNLKCFLLHHAEDDGCVQENYDFNGADIRKVEDVHSIERCAGLCADEDGCVAVTHHPELDNCWLKNKPFGEDPQDKDGFRSRNLQCGRGVWCEHPGSFLYLYANDPVIKYTDFDEAAKACVENDDCFGITQEPYNQNKYTIRRGPTIFNWSPSDETSWTLC